MCVLNAGDFVKLKTKLFNGCVARVLSVSPTGVNVEFDAGYVSLNTGFYSFADVEQVEYVPAGDFDSVVAQRLKVLLAHPDWFKPVVVNQVDDVVDDAESIHKVTPTPDLQVGVMPDDCMAKVFARIREVESEAAAVDQVESSLCAQCAHHPDALEICEPICDLKSCVFVAVNQVDTVYKFRTSLMLAPNWKVFKAGILMWHFKHGFPHSIPRENLYSCPARYW